MTLPLRNSEYGKPEECEIGGCENNRGAPLASERTYGCVLCTFHEDKVQLGEIEIPESASEGRKQKAWDKILA